jgi:hypothetical protein
MQQDKSHNNRQESQQKPVEQEEVEQEQAPQTDLKQVMEMLATLTSQVSALSQKNTELEQQLKDTQSQQYQLAEQVLNSVHNESVLVEAHRKEPKVAELDGKYAGITRIDN